ncbi:MAG TPA: alpha/beta hydrolase [Candidatus Nanopelagicales bacterium]|nr:alpha/beta hydrolase [Candidatus Nanopelagicales bacterium]
MGLLVHLPSMVASAARVTLRRAQQGPLRPGWSWTYEVFVEHLKALSRRFHGLPPAAQRAGWNSTAVPSTTARKVRRERAEVGGVEGAWITPRAGHDERVVLYFHGGAYIYGTLETHAELMERIAIAARARVLGVSYRLAPEHPFPAGIDDAVAAYRGLLESGVAPGRVVLAGDSAGGGLAAATLITLRDAGDPLPAGAVLICPWVDMTARGGSMVTNEAYDWASADDVDGWAAAYLGGANPRDGRASPLYGDLAGLPPLLVQVGGAELLRDQVLAFVERARAAGVTVEREIAQDMVHNWHVLAATERAAREAIEGIGGFARRVVA